MPAAAAASSPTRPRPPVDPDSPAPLGALRRACEPLRLEPLHQRVGAVALDLGDLLADRGAERRRRGVGHHAAARQHDDAVARLRLREIMRGEEHGRAPFPPLRFEQRPHPVAVLGIEPDGRLVEDQEIGLVQRRPRDIQQPAPAARELPARLVRPLAKPGPVERLRDRRAGRPVRPIRRAARQTRRFSSHREQAVHARLLEHESQAPANRRAARAPCHGRTRARCRGSGRAEWRAAAW